MELRPMMLVAVALCLLLPGVPAKAVTMTMPYEGPAVGSYQGLADCTDLVRSRGTLCVEIPDRTAGFDLAVMDESGLRIGGVYYLHAADGSDAGLGRFCGAMSLPLTGEETTLVLRLDAVHGPAACVDAGHTGSAPATKGVVAIQLR